VGELLTARGNVSSRLSSLINARKEMYLELYNKDPEFKL